MIIDAQGQFCSNQVLTVTAPSTNQLDFGKTSVAKNSNGAYAPEILLWVGATFAGGAGTLQVQIRSSTVAAMTSPVIHDQSAVFALADLAAGAKFLFQPRVPINILQFVDLNFVVGAGPFTLGNISAAIITGRQISQ